MVFIRNPLGQISASRVPKYQDGYILPVLSPQELLKTNRYQSIIEKMREMAGVPDNYFDTLYFSALTNFAEFVQLIPAQPFGAISGLLSQGIARAYLALKAYHEEYENKDPLLCYAVVTAALFVDISKVLINQKVLIVDDQGGYVDDWRPFEGTLIDQQAQFYKMYEVNPVYQRLDQSIKPLVARQLMPDLGFLWISGDPIIFAEWLDALRGEKLQGGRVEYILELIRDEEFQELMRELMLLDYEMTVSFATEYGEAFLKWLKENINNGKLEVNTENASVHRVDEGVFLEAQKLYVEFAKLYNSPATFNVVFTQFGNLMGIAEKGGQDFVHTKYFSKYAHSQGGSKFASPLSQPQKTLREGMVLSDPARLFMNSQIPATSPMLKALQSKGAENRSLPAMQINTPQSQYKK